MKKILFGLFAVFLAVAGIRAAEIGDLSTSDASNTGRFPENQAPSTVNDGARALEGLLARAFKDTLDGIVTTAGTSTAYTASANRTLTAFYDGLEMSLQIHTTSGASPTLSVDSITAQSMVWPNGTAITASDIPSGAIVKVKYDNDNTRWIVQTLPNKFGTAASKDTGTSNGSVPLMDATGYPAADGSQITNLNASNLASGTVPSARLPSADDTTVGGVEIATQAEMEAATATTPAVTPGRAQYHPGVAKAWVYITTSGGTVTVAASHNVSSVTDNAAGDYTTNFTTAFSTANYVSAAMVKRDTGQTNRLLANTKGDTAQTETAHRWQVTANDISLADPPAASVVYFGDQ